MGRIDDEGRRVFGGIRTANNTLAGADEQARKNGRARRWDGERFVHPRLNRGCVPSRISQGCPKTGHPRRGRYTAKCSIPHSQTMAVLKKGVVKYDGVSTAPNSKGVHNGKSDSGF